MWLEGAAVSGWLTALLARLRGAPAAAPALGEGLAAAMAQALPVAVLPASARFSACLAEVLRHEGGFVDHPADPGGATNRGITLATLSDWRGRPVSKSEVRALTVAEAAAIYRARYWDVVQGDRLPPGVDLAVFDFAVNSGPGRAARTLQQVLVVPQDGAIGPVTLAALARAPGPVTLIIALCDARLRFLRGLPTWPTFGKGWARRVEEVEGAALRVAG